MIVVAHLSPRLSEVKQQESQRRLPRALGGHMRQNSKNWKNAIFVSSTLSFMNPLLSSSATCVAQGRRACNLDSPIDFIADFPWYGRGGEQRKYERKERGVGQKKKLVSRQPYYIHIYSYTNIFLQYIAIILQLFCCNNILQY